MPVCRFCEMEYDAAFRHECPPPAPPNVVEMTTFLAAHGKLGRVSREFRSAVILGAKIMDGSITREI